MAHDANGRYIGLGVGDSNADTLLINRKLHDKFQWARDMGVTATQPYTITTAHAIESFCTRVGLPILLDDQARAIANLATRQRLGAAPPPAKPVIFTVEGHLSNMWIGPTASVASTLEQQSICKWQPVGYDCGTLPFNNKSGVDELIRLVGDTNILPAGISWGIVGFSQGAMIVSEFMMQHVLPDTGVLHWRLPSFKRGLCFGNPRRETGKECAWAANPVKPGTEGIMGAGGLFVTTGTPIEKLWAEHANHGDMFAENAEDSEGLDKTAIAKIVCENSWIGGQASIVARVLKLLGHIPQESIPAIMAAISAIMFLAANPNPHYSTVADPGDVQWMAGVA
jgi:hypothetical protein